MTSHHRDHDIAVPLDPGALHSANGLLNARLTRRISRRELIERAGQLGLAAGVVGILLTATGDTAGAAEAKPVSARTRTEPKGKRRSGGELTAGVVGGIDTLNPYVTDLYTPTMDILSGVMDGLTGFDSRHRIRPTLAESYQISDDGEVYTFRLRPGITFHNGDAFTAQDVVETWSMIMSDDLPVWSRIGWDRIEAIEVPDASTLVVRTDGPFAPFLASISAGFLSGGMIAPSRYLKGPETFRKQFEEKPIGTGPFRFKSVKGNVATLERYNKHWAGKPYLDQINVRIFETYGQLFDAYKAGEIALVDRTGTPGRQNLPRALRMPETTVLEFTGLSWGHLDLKQIGLLRDTKVRQALDYATPKDQIISEIMGGEAVRAVADQPPGTSYYNQNITPRPFDIEKAQSLLRRAGLETNGDGMFAKDDQELEIELWGEARDPQAEGILALVAESWTAMGAKVSVKLANGADLWGPKGYQFTERMTAGYYRSNNANDPDNMWYWHSSQIPAEPGGPGGNAIAFFNQYTFQDKIDDLTSRAAAETDPVKRKEHYYEIQELLHEEAPVIFLFWDQLYAACRSNVGSFWPSAYTYLLWNAKDWYIAK